jgi:peptidoglycan hydrolase-like protein with peptidoglycan-binding domain
MIQCWKPAARSREPMRGKMSNLLIKTSLVLASLICASGASASAPGLESPWVSLASVSSPAPSPQQSGGATTTTTAKKKKSSKNHHASKREPTQKAPTPQRISEIQSALAHGGYYQGAPNGKWDSNTVTAMQKFQSDNGLSSSGKIDAPSLQKLGLGSGTAGVDAPKPVAPATPAATANSATSTSPAIAAPTTASAVSPTPNSPAPAPKLQR